MNKNKTIATLIGLIILLTTTIVFSVLNVSKKITKETILIIILILIVAIIINFIYLFIKYIKKIDVSKTIDKTADWLIFLTMTISFILMFMNFVMASSIVDGESMMPTLNDKSRLVVLYFNYEPKNDDIIIIRDNDKYLVKRVIALPGDKIEFIKNDDYSFFLYLNGSEIPVKDGFGNNYLIEINSSVWYQKEYILAENELFILGDNGSSSTSSSDSKQNGFYELHNVIGKVVWPK